MSEQLFGPLFGVYVHWPFCVSKCPYCDFNSHVRESVEHERWRDGLKAELRHYAARTAGREVTSIFFGGGTPSLMRPDTVAAVIDTIVGLWSVAPDVEITLEANPSSVEAGKFAALRSAGVNRVSLGVQALDDESLRFLGRHHSLAEALAAIATARRTFDRMSFDLIYARPQQDVAAWRHELDHALSYAADHLSLYQLTIEKGTRFYQAHRSGEFVLPDEETAAELYEVTQASLCRAGLPAYEISNHARPGQACRHNLGYWQYEDYVGIGPGAHGRFAADRTKPAGGKWATRAIAGPESWLARVESVGDGLAEQQMVVGDDLASEALMMGLRLSDGVRRSRFEELTGRDPAAAVVPDALASMIDAGFVELTPLSLRATAAGRQRLNAVLECLLA